MQDIKKKFILFSPIYWPAWCGFGLLWLITRLPYRWQIAIGSSMGKCLFLFPTKLKHTTLINLQLCFPDYTTEQRNALAKKNFESLGIGLIEAAMAWWLPDEKVNGLYKIVGLEYAEEAFKKGKGIILIGPHFTCLEMVGRLIRKHYTFGVMYRPHKKTLYFLYPRTLSQKTLRQLYSPKSRP